jgi:hypothetical protein
MFKSELNRREVVMGTKGNNSPHALVSVAEV